MKGKRVYINLLLPNGRNKQFVLQTGKNLKAQLESQLKDCYPRSDKICLVEELREKSLLAGRPYESGVMFEIRKNFYEHGHVIASTGKP